MENNYCVIMAGGIGSRFWPLSTVKKPKQFLDILGTGETLIQQTYNRFKGIVPKENFLIVTSDIYKELCLQQLPELSSSQILTEPNRRNTAPCIAYSNARIESLNKDARIIVTPSDHLILKEDEFRKKINEGLDYCAKSGDLLTLGIKPLRPETGYGYIQFKNSNESGNIKKVKAFTEKPDEELAKVFLNSGDFLWNSGIFIWTLNSIKKEFQEYLPSLHSLFEAKQDYFGTEKETKAIESIYSKCESISIDYGIMEKTKNVSVSISDIGWSDLGTWGSLYEEREKDENNNTVIGENVNFNGISDCLIDIDKETMTVLNDIKDLIVVKSGNYLLVSSKNSEQKIKEITDKL